MWQSPGISRNSSKHSINVSLDSSSPCTPSISRPSPIHPSPVPPCSAFLCAHQDTCPLWLQTTWNGMEQKVRQTISFGRKPSVRHNVWVPSPGQLWPPPAGLRALATNFPPSVCPSVRPSVRTPKIQVQTPEIQVQTPEIQVQTPEIQVQTSTIQLQTPKTHLHTSKTCIFMYFHILPCIFLFFSRLFYIFLYIFIC